MYFSHDNIFILTTYIVLVFVSSKFISKSMDTDKS